MHVVRGDLFEAALDIEFVPHGVHANQHELALAVERVSEVVKGVEVRVPEDSGYEGEREGKIGRWLRGLGDEKEAG